MTDAANAGGPTPAGNIYDLGYRGYEGPRLGRRAAVGALVTHSVRSAWGLGRSARSKLVPMGLLVFALLPALVALGIAAIASQVGAAGEAIEARTPVRYSSLFLIIAPMAMVFCASQAPELFGRDQRYGVLPLYFARAISRLDYAVARALGLLGSLALLVLAPQLVLLVGRVLAAPDVLDGLRREAASLPMVLGVGVAMSVLLGTIAAAVAALTPRRSYATVAVIAVFIVPTIVAALLVELAGGVASGYALLLSPRDVLDGLNALAFDVDPDSPIVEEAALDGWLYVVAAVAWVVGAAAVLARRFVTVRT